MRNRKNLLVPLVIVGGLLLWAVPTVSGERVLDGSSSVDFRMAPLEQVKKINAFMLQRHGTGETLTVMAWDGHGDGKHLIVARKPAPLAEAFVGGIDSVSWHHAPEEPSGTCDSRSECEEAVHGGVNSSTVTVVLHADGSQTCSADCSSNGAVAMVTCNP